MLDSIIDFGLVIFLIAFMLLIPWSLYMAVESSAKEERSNYKETCEQIGGKVVWNGKFYECFTKGSR